MDNTNRYDIKYLFEPESIAVIGASPDKKKIGYAVFNNIISGGYKGKVFPVSPKGGDIEGACTRGAEKEGPALCVVPAGGDGHRGQRYHYEGPHCRQRPEHGGIGHPAQRCLFIFLQNDDPP